MTKKEKQLTLTSKLLLTLVALEDILTVVSPYELRSRVLFGNRRSYENTLYSLHKKGWIKFVNSEKGKFLQLTKKGQLETLLVKALLPVPQKWDGKWRVIMFDIPEESKEKRNTLRWLLKKNNFFQLQASVYINPYPLNREAVEYLQQTGLIAYIRILKIEEMDNDKELKKHFKLG